MKNITFSKLTKISLWVCAGCIAVAVVSFVLYRLTDLAEINDINLTIGLIAILAFLLSFAMFCFSSGYNKESGLFYLAILVITIPLIVYTIYDAAANPDSVIGYVAGGIAACVFFLAQVIRRFGLIVRRFALKDRTVRVIASVVLIFMFLLLSIVAFIFTGAMMVSDPPDVY